MFPQVLTSGVTYKFQCGPCNESYYGKCVRHSAVRSGEYIDISPLTNRRLQPGKNSAICQDLLDCNYSDTFKYFSVLCHNSKKYLLELKESLFIMRDRPSMNQNIRSALPHLFEWVFGTLWLFGRLMWSSFCFIYVNF